MIIIKFLYKKHLENGKSDVVNQLELTDRILTRYKLKKSFLSNNKLYMFPNLHLVRSHSLCKIEKISSRKAFYHPYGSNYDNIFQ